MYHRRGFSVQNAVEMVERRERALAYVFLAVPARRWQDVIELARRHDNVLEASVVYGESEDVILKLFAPDDGDIYGVLGDALRAAAIAGQPTILRVGERSFVRQVGVGKGGAVQAYVLIKASAKQVEIVLEALRGIDGVAEASTVYGETDVICRLVVPDQAALDRLVMREIHAIDAVESTRTFIVVGDMSWRRD
ncbi:MAG: Lrp/AsnC family transcriptional regulator [Chloroflexota bacterium]|nr:MAG: Lrp/AsnC family transcriptional regulator [Chloroflexota bacterium]